MNTRILLLVSMVAVTHNQLMVSAAQTQTEASKKAGPATGSAPVTPPAGTISLSDYSMKIAHKTQGMSFGKIGMSINDPLERTVALFNFMNNTRTHCHYTAAGHIGAYNLDAAFSDGTLQPVTNFACLFLSPKYSHPIQINEHLAKLKELLNYTGSNTVTIVPSVHSLVAIVPHLAPNGLLVEMHPFSDTCHWCKHNQAHPIANRTRWVTTAHDEDCFVGVDLPALPAPTSASAAPETPAAATT